MSNTTSPNRGTNPSPRRYRHPMRDFGYPRSWFPPEPDPRDRQTELLEQLVAIALERREARR